MAYCVHCGVRLGPGENSCPLCKTPIYDPAEPDAAPAPKAFLQRTPEQELKRSKRFLLSLNAVLLLSPALLCVVIDLLTHGNITWSGYAAGALLMLFVSITAPLLAKKYQEYVAFAVSFICLLGYLFLVERLSGSGPWFSSVALPALVLAAGLVMGIIALYRGRLLNRLTLIAAGLIAAGLECLGIDWLCNLASTGEGGFVWSPYVLAPCLFLAVSIFVINGNRVVREELRRRVHF